MPNCWSRATLERLRMVRDEIVANPKNTIGAKEAKQFPHLLPLVGQLRGWCKSELKLINAAIAEKEAAL